MLTDTPQIAVVNESTIVTQQQAWNIAWALGYSVRWQFGPLWKVAADVVLLPKGVAVPSGSWILHLLDTADQEGALGYHDEDGNEMPYGRIFAKTSQENGVPLSEVADHELKELLIDPHVNATVYDPKSGRLIAYEVGDPAQGGPYDIGDPYGRKTGIVMSDFALPSWFDPNTPSHQSTSYRGTCTGPFNIGKGGYMSYTKTLPPNWQQQLGELVKPGTVDADDRAGRRFAAAV
jgi:hypothetical protein